jgi:hypothetical protein
MCLNIVKIDDFCHIAGQFVNIRIKILYIAALSAGIFAA